VSGGDDPFEGEGCRLHQRLGEFAWEALGGVGEEIGSLHVGFLLCGFESITAACRHEGTLPLPVLLADTGGAQ
jgi:hypothetical protein